MASSRFHFYSLVFFATLVFPISCQSHLSSPGNHVALFIFGDSLYDAGNNNYLKSALGRANYWPYGETFFKHPTGRFTDGRTIADFIAEYAKLPLIQPYLQPDNDQFTDGVNFASGGAGALVETYQGLVIDFKTQLSYFKNVKKQLRQKLGDAETKILLSRAIYLISIGSNDYLAPFSTNSSVLQSYSRKEYVGMVIGNVTTVIKGIYTSGGRKFGFMNLGPLGCIPAMKALIKNNTVGCLEEATDLAEQHNRAFSKVLIELQIELKEFKYSYFDFYTALSERIDNPSKYGFKEGKVACCGSGPYRGIWNCGGQGAIKEYQLCDNASEYLFFDAGHPSDKANNQFATLMWGGSSNVRGGYNLKTLLEA